MKKFAEIIQERAAAAIFSEHKSEKINEGSDSVLLLKLLTERLLKLAWSSTVQGLHSDPSSCGAGYKQI